MGFQHTSMGWHVLAGLDMKGNHPDSGWQELEIQ